MSRKSVGYFEGTDSRLLTGLICEGYDTIPVGNGFDNHGRHIESITEASRFDLLIGYFHKIYSPTGARPTYQDIFHVCRIYEMPLLLEVPSELQAAASELIGEAPEYVHLIDPDGTLDAARRVLAD